MQDAPKAVWSISYVSVAFFPSLKQNFIEYRSSKVSSRPDCIFEIHQLWQSGFSRVYSNCCCSCSFEREIIKIGQPSHKMYSNNILNFQESTTILNAHTKKIWKLIVCTLYICVSVCVCARACWTASVSISFYISYSSEELCGILDLSWVCLFFLLRGIRLRFKTICNISIVANNCYVGHS